MPNMIGAYGDWASGLAQDPPKLSFRRGGWRNVADWQRQARGRYLETLLRPDTGGVPRATVQHRVEYDGLAFEHLSWQLPYGPPTEAVFVKPAERQANSLACLACMTMAGISTSERAKSRGCQPIRIR